MPAKTPYRYPLFQAFMNRFGQFNNPTDAYVMNGYLDTYGEKKYVVKRPGTQTAVNLGTGTAPNQGCFYFNGFDYTIYNDTLMITGTQNSATNGANFTKVTSPPIPWLKRTYSQALVFNKRIFLLGAGIDTAGAAHGDIWSTADGLNWNSATAGAGINRWQHGCVVFNGNMYIIGGLATATGQTLSDVLISPDGTNWTQVTSSAPWGPRRDFGCCVYKGQIFIIGGYNSTTPLNDVWASPDGVAWVQVVTPAISFPARGGNTTVVFNNKMFMIGGASNSTAFNDVWSSSDGIVWNTASTTPFSAGMSNTAVVVYANKLWVLGGYFYSAGSQSSDVYSSPTGLTGSWTHVTGSPGWGARGAPCAVVFQTPPSVSQFRYQTIWVMSGGVIGATVYADMWYGTLNSNSVVSVPLNPTTTGQQYQFNTFNNGQQLILKNQSNAWLYNNGALNVITDTNYPAFTVPGLIVLNSFAYVMDPNGEIYSCADADFTTWPALQTTTADFEDDPGVCLIKYTNYIMALGQYTVQFYYDGGYPPPGISISEYISANSFVGCANAFTACQAENNVLWVGQSKDRDVGVYMMNGMMPQRISPSWVDKAINQNPPTFAFVFGFEGHRFYVLGLAGVQQVLVYDIPMQQWYVWQAGSNSGVTYPFFVNSFTNFQTGGDYLIGAPNTPWQGTIQEVNTVFNSDNNVLFDLIVQTDKIDGGTLKRKRLPRAELVCDLQLGGSTPLLQYTDNDYVSYSTGVTFNAGLMRPYIGRLGSFNRRAFLLTQTDNQPARWEALDLYLEA